MFFDREFTFDRVVRIIITLVLVVGSIFLLDYLSSVLVPFVIAVILAYLLNPFINFVQKLVKKRFLAVFIGMVLIFGVLTGIGFILVPMISNEVSRASELIGNLVSNTDWHAQLNKYLPESIATKIEDFVKNGDLLMLFDQKEMSKVWEFGVNKVLPEIGSFLNYSIEVIIGIFGLFIVILYMFFLLLDFDDVVTEWKGLMPPKYKNMIMNFANEFEVAMNNYFRAQALIAAIVGVLFAIGFAIIGLPLGIVLGLLIGFMSMIPYLKNVAVVPAIFLGMLQSLETGQSLWTVLGLVLLVFVVVQTLEDLILVPKIMGNATGLNPAVIVLSLSIWGKVLGMLGLLIALPLTYLLLSYYKRLISKSNKKEGPSMIKTDYDLISENLRKLPGDE